MSLSLGFLGIEPTTEAALLDLTTAGVTVVAAAGNEDVDACLLTPGRMPKVITVGAVDQWNKRPDWSNWGTCVDVAAPGVGIISASNSRTATAYYRSDSGTSARALCSLGRPSLVLTLPAARCDAGMRKSVLMC